MLFSQAPRLLSTGHTATAACTLLHCCCSPPAYYKGGGATPAGRPSSSASLLDVQCGSSCRQLTAASAAGSCHHGLASPSSSGRPAVLDHSACFQVNHHRGLGWRGSAHTHTCVRALAQGAVRVEGTEGFFTAPTQPARHEDREVGVPFEGSSPYLHNKTYGAARRAARYP